MKCNIPTFLKTIPFMICLLFLFAACNGNDDNDASNCTLSLPASTIDCESEDVDPSINGFMLNYFANEVDKSSEGNYTNGECTGFWKFYFENGQIHWEGNYTDGQVDGFFNVYYESGALRTAGHYDECVKTGFWNYHFDNNANQVQFTGNYDNGSPNGTWQEFNEAGDLIESYDCN